MNQESQSSPGDRMLQGLGRLVADVRRARSLASGTSGLSGVTCGQTSLLGFCPGDGAERAAGSAEPNENAEAGVPLTSVRESSGFYEIPGQPSENANSWSEFWLHGWDSAGAASSGLCPQPERVFYCGVPLEFLVVEASFEATAGVLLRNELPSEDELSDCDAILRDSAVPDGSLLALMGRLPMSTPPQELFPFAISLFGLFDTTGTDRGPAAARTRLWRLMGQLPAILRAGMEATSFDDVRTVIDEGSELSWAGRTLSLLRPGVAEVTPVEDLAVNAVMTCQAVPRMRHACFVSRVAGSAVQDPLAAVQSAATLFAAQLDRDPFAWTAGVLEGFRRPDDVDAWLEKRGDLPMPFGFSDDPQDVRGLLLKRTCRSLLGSYDRLIQESCATRLERRLAESGLFPNVDWLSARIMTLLGIPADRQFLFVGLARLVGWAAQAREQQNSGAGLLPQLRYASGED